MQYDADNYCKSDTLVFGLLPRLSYLHHELTSSIDVASEAYPDNVIYINIVATKFHNNFTILEQTKQNPI